jgi:hypothetical protein
MVIIDPSFVGSSSFDLVVLAFTIAKAFAYASNPFVVEAYRLTFALAYFLLDCCPFFQI